MIGRIYAIKSNKTDKVYIGSTLKTIEKRLSRHKNNYKNYLKGTYHYVSSFDIIQHDDVYIELLEEVNVENKQELCKIEGKYIKEMECVNQRIEGQSRKQWHEDNKEKIKEYHKEYRNTNKEKIKEQNINYYHSNKEKIKEHHKEYRNANKEQMKDYYQQNKEHISEKRKQYYQENKEHILDRMKEIFTCECGSTIAKSSVRKHKHSSKHKKYIDNINEISKE